MVKTSFRIGNFCLALICAMLVISCSNPDERPSVLLIAVEGLSFDTFTCTSENLQTSADLRGFKTFCDEGVRFTHAYVPSVLSVPTLASIFTGLYPTEHKVRNHGSDFLSANYETLAEKALQMGYQTSFISGGAPVFRKSGLHQGFEYFEDNLRVERSGIYRPLFQSAKLFNNWIHRTSSNKPFFATIFAADMQFPSWPTVNNEGLERSSTVRGQFEELGESLQQIVERLKKMNRWDKTHVILVGLNGDLLRPSDRDERSFNLLSSNTQVQLFIKPATKKRDLALQWTVDRNVSLVDLGPTLAHMMGLNLSQRSQWPVYSLESALTSPNASWPTDRVIVSESAWPYWHDVGAIRYALRSESLLYLHDRAPKIHNTLIDRQEIVTISKTDPLIQAPLNKLTEFVTAKDLSPWRNVPVTLNEKLAVSRGLWRQSQVSEALKNRLVHLSKKRTWDSQVQGWLSEIYIKQSNWKELLKLSKEAGIKEWGVLAKSHLGLDIKRDSLRGCGQALVDIKAELSPRDCSDKVFMALRSWINLDKKRDVEKAKESFLRLYRRQQLDRMIGEKNFEIGLMWSTPSRFAFGPSYSFLTLEMPGFEKYKKQVLARLPIVNL